MRDVTESTAAVARVERRNLAALIEDGRISGMYRKGPHGHIINATGGRSELTDLVAGNPSLFEDTYLLIEKLG
jgi:hypothetical protein